MSGEIRYLISLAKDGLASLTGRAKEKKENAIEAHRLLNKAFISTYDYLRNKNGEYVPNPELADIWNEASSAVMKVNEGLGHDLYYKSRFWLDPELYKRLNREDEIISLNEIVDEMEKIRDRI